MPKEKPLSLENLIKYNEEVLFPFMKETFVTNKKFKEFENDTIKFQDKVLKDLESLKQEKTASDAQDKRKTKVLQIHNDALKTKKILSDSEVSQIEKLHAF